LVLEEQLTPPTSSSSIQSTLSTLPFQTSLELTSDTSADVNPSQNLPTCATTIASPRPSFDINSDRTSSSTTNINIISPCTSYLIAEAQVNGISGVVLLDTGSGLTIISSRHWSIIGAKSAPPAVYDGPDIHGPEGSSIRPVGLVNITITIAGVVVQHQVILAQNFEHLILLGNDFMKIIGLVLDIQANKMWLRSRPDITY